MEFSFDISQTPIIGRRVMHKSENAQSWYLTHNNSGVQNTNSPRRSASLSPADTTPLSGWKRPWMSQGRVRECLVNLLTTCGQRVGLPKSPSVSIHLLNVSSFLCASSCDRLFAVCRVAPF